MLGQIDAPAGAQRGPTLLAAGFRPFFLLSGLGAALMVPAWLVIWLGGHSLQLAYAPSLWHGHEMLFGYAGAAVAGFMLTAVPNWTGAPPLKGASLLALVALWLAARLAFALGGGLPPVVGAAASILFFPCLALVLTKPLVIAGKPHNFVFPPILGLLALADGLVLAEMLGFGAYGRNGLLLALFIVLLMIGIIGGRIIPGFTANGLRLKGIIVTPRKYPWLERVGSIAIAATGAAWTLRPDSALAGGLALIAGLLNAGRMVGWHGSKTARVPLLWVLHLGFAWLPVGLALLGASCFLSGVPETAALHGLTAGCIGLMTLGVMSRAALGHSGRPLEPHRLTVAAYGLVALAGLIRTFGVLLAPDTALIVSGSLWSIGFLLYVAVYAPICLKPRADGRPG